MEKQEEVMYRKGLSPEELKKAKEKTKEEHIKAYINEGVFAGFFLFVVVSELIGLHLNIFWTGILGGCGAAFGATVAYLEKLLREKRGKTIK